MSADQSATIGLDPQQLDECFPFHLACGADLTIVQVGSSLRKLGEFAGRRLDEVFTCRRPIPRLVLADIVTHQGHPFVLYSEENSLTLRGQMLALPAGAGVIFVASPAATGLKELTKLGLTLSDLPAHDVTADLLILLESQRTSLRDLEEVTEKLEAKQSELSRVANQAEAASRSKSAFMANVSHEIRTPLNAILGLSGVLSKADLTIDQQRLLKTLCDASEHLFVLVDDLLDVVRVEQGKLELESRAFELRRTLDEALGFVQGQSEAKGLELSCLTDASLPGRIVGDPQRLRQILVNLLVNGIKYTDRGEVRLEVTRAGESIQFVVQDTGRGITPLDQARVFDPFVRLDGTETLSGVGLGLTITKGLVSLLGGQLEVESEVDSGSRFSFRLQLEEADEAPSTARFFGLGADWARGLRILVAEDSEPNRIVLREFLRDTPHELVFVHDGAQAVETCLNGQFDVVLMDVRMPVLDGYSATKRIRSHERERGLPRVPILALTAHAFEESRRQSQEVGCDEHLTKPLRCEELFSALKRLTEPQAGVAGLVAETQSSSPPLTPAERLRAYAGEYVESQQALASAALDGLARGKTDAALTLGHNLKGTGATYGFPELSERGRSLESAARVGDALAARSHLERLFEELAVARRSL